jgi:hypothetical protein
VRLANAHQSPAHDFLGPAYGVAYCAYRGGHSRSGFVLRQLPGREDTGCNQQHALAAFIHEPRLSSFVFYSPQSSCTLGLVPCGKDEPSPPLMERLTSMAVEEMNGHRSRQRRNLNFMQS